MLQLLYSGYYSSGMYGFNYYYLVLVIPVLILSLVAQARVNSAYKKYSAVNNMRGITGEMAAREVLRLHGITNVRIERIHGKLTDHYDPRDNVIRLSDGVFGSCSVAAVGIACHEAGHAVQHAQGYVPIKIRNAVLKPAQIGSQAAFPIAILGLILGFSSLVYVGIFLYVFIMLFQLFTLPVEFNASMRAVKVIEGSGMLSGNELVGTKKVLRAAAMTYVASFAVTAANLLRLILLANNRRR